MKNQSLNSYAIIGVAVVLAALVLAFGFKNIRQPGSGFSVTGSAIMHVTSDTAKLSGNISMTVPASGLEQAYVKVAADAAKVKALAQKSGLSESEVTVSAPSLSEQFSYGQNGNITAKNYYVSQRVSVSTNNVSAVTALGGALSELAKSGVIFQTGGPEYYYSKLAEARVSLMGEAIKDARARAESIAKSAGSEVGALQSVSSGVIQVLAANSTDISDYGSYDSSTIAKDIAVTVRAAFAIK